MNQKSFLREGLIPSGRISFLYVTGIIFLFYLISTAMCETPSYSNEGERSAILVTQRNWRVEYPKLMEMGFKEWPSQDGAINISHPRIHLYELLNQLNITTSSLLGMYGDVYYSTLINPRTQLSITIVPTGDPLFRWDAVDFVAATISNYSEEENRLKSRHQLRKGTISSRKLMAYHFRMKESGEWIREGMRLDEIVDLLDLNMKTIQYKLEDVSPGVFSFRIPAIWSKVNLQLSSVPPASLLNNLPLDTLTTVTVVGATPEDPFPYKPNLKPDLAQALLDAGLGFVNK